MPNVHEPIVARGVDRSYRDRRILNAVDITVPRGARTGLIGENGVGKSTLLSVLAGSRSPMTAASDAPSVRTSSGRKRPSTRATIRQLLDEYTAELRAIARELEDAAANMQAGNL